ncbi:unnamed protein product [Vitrella brassicaformis CCMP3155]|uniref:Uncharacterized protein n=1 Tax=Vitrella brassicaformis (strain CCMP3155) TaxID=1169540 RepID=A0A0G4G790_VITBC|nr:unnamed protein product [Vitrella brassicaformis CCMP3155]|eukprot:CEM24105.1 unnamed protein product [Vitrella brassicaformis CCMP3155]
MMSSSLGHTVNQLQRATRSIATQAAVKPPAAAFQRVPDAASELVGGSAVGAGATQRRNGETSSLESEFRRALVQLTFAFENPHLKRNSPQSSSLLFDTSARIGPSSQQAVWERLTAILEQHLEHASRSSCFATARDMLELLGCVKQSHQAAWGRGRQSGSLEDATAISAGHDWAVGQIEEGDALAALLAVCSRTLEHLVKRQLKRRDQEGEGQLRDFIGCFHALSIPLNHPLPSLGHRVAELLVALHGSSGVASDKSAPLLIDGSDFTKLFTALERCSVLNHDVCRSFEGFMSHLLERRRIKAVGVAVLLEAYGKAVVRGDRSEWGGHLERVVPRLVAEQHRWARTMDPYAIAMVFYAYGRIGKHYSRAILCLPDDARAWHDSSDLSDANVIDWGRVVDAIVTLSPRMDGSVLMNVAVGLSWMQWRERQIIAVLVDVFVRLCHSQRLTPQQFSHSMLALASLEVWDPRLLAAVRTFLSTSSQGFSLQHHSLTLQALTRFEHQRPPSPTRILAKEQDAASAADIQDGNDHYNHSYSAAFLPLTRQISDDALAIDERQALESLTQLVMRHFKTAVNGGASSASRPYDDLAPADFVHILESLETTRAQDVSLWRHILPSLRRSLETNSHHWDLHSALSVFAHATTLDLLSPLRIAHSPTEPSESLHALLMSLLHRYLDMMSPVDALVAAEGLSLSHYSVEGWDEKGRMGRLVGALRHRMIGGLRSLVSAERPARRGESRLNFKDAYERSVYSRIGVVLTWLQLSPSLRADGQERVHA